MCTKEKKRFLWLFTIMAIFLIKDAVSASGADAAASDRLNRYRELARTGSTPDIRKVFQEEVRMLARQEQQAIHDQTLDAYRKESDSKFKARLQDKFGQFAPVSLWQRAKNLAAAPFKAVGNKATQKMESFHGALPSVVQRNITPQGATAAALLGAAALAGTGVTLTNWLSVKKQYAQLVKAVRELRAYITQYSDMSAEGFDCRQFMMMVTNMVNSLPLPPEAAP